jgi:hypothetical protein
MLRCVMTDSPATGMAVNRCGMRSYKFGAVGYDVSAYRHGEAMPLKKQCTLPAVDVSECPCWCV